MKYKEAQKKLEKAESVRSEKVQIVKVVEK